MSYTSPGSAAFTGFIWPDPELNFSNWCLIFIGVAEKKEGLACGIYY